VFIKFFRRLVSHPGIFILKLYAVPSRYMSRMIGTTARRTNMTFFPTIVFVSDFHDFYGQFILCMIGFGFPCELLRLICER